jgi:hypothetical protein
MTRILQETPVPPTIEPDHPIDAPPPYEPEAPGGDDTDEPGEPD